MPVTVKREDEWSELVRANQALQRKYTSARDENDLASADIYKQRWNRQQELMRAFLARLVKTDKRP